MLEKEFLVALALLIEVELALDGDGAFVKLAGHFHCTLDFVLVATDDRAGVLHKTRDLPTALLVFKDKGVIESQAFRGIKRGDLYPAVDEQLAANAQEAFGLLVGNGSEA